MSRVLRRKNKIIMCPKRINNSALEKIVYSKEF